MLTPFQQYLVTGFHVDPAKFAQPATTPTVPTSRPVPVRPAPTPAPAPVQPIAPVAARPTAPVIVAQTPTPVVPTVSVQPVAVRPVPVKPLPPTAPAIGDTSGHTAPANSPASSPAPAVPTATVPAPTVGDAATNPSPTRFQDALNIDRHASDVDVPSSGIAGAVGGKASPDTSSSTATPANKHLIGIALIGLLVLLLVIHAARR